MPLDGRNYPITETIATKEAFWAASTRERRAMLSYALRHLPTTHMWCFSHVGGKTDCGTIGCAKGWAQEYWGAWIGHAELGMSEHAFNVVFGFGMSNWSETYALYGVMSHDDVRPAQVADAISAYLA